MTLCRHSEQVILMGPRKTDCTQALHDEIDQTPEQYRPLLLRVAGPSVDKRLLDTQEALDDLKAGRVVEGDEVMLWLDSWGTDGEQAAPKQ